MTDTATDAAPAPAQEAPAAPPAVDGAPPGQRSTGGDLSTGRPAPRPIDREGAQAVLRQAYGRQRELQERQAEPDAPVAPEAPAEPARRPQRPPRAPTPPAPAPAERGANGRFLPAKGAAQPDASGAPVDGAPDAAVQQTPTPAPPRRDAPARAPATQGSPARQPATPGVEAIDAPPSSATPEAGPQPAAPVPERDEATATSADFKSARWLRALQAEPGLRRTVGRIQADPNLSASAKAAQLAEKLADGERAADAAEWRGQQMRDLRDANPQAFIQQLKADEAEAEASNQLALRITQMIAEAYEVDPDDPDFLEAGPRDGDDRMEGLRRFVEFTSKKSPVFKTTVVEALEAQQQAHQASVEALKAQHKLDVEAAVERGRSQGRSPYGRGGAPPRTNGTGVVPVGQDEGPGGGPRVPAKAPTVAGIRDLIGMGYQQREPAT